MAPAGVALPSIGAGSESNTALVAACLAGDEDAWSTLIDRYKRLIFSIPIKQGFDADTAADIFQSVCLDLVTELPRLREPQALAQWLIRVTSRRCVRQRTSGRAATEVLDDLAGPTSDLPESILQEVQQEQAVRDAIGDLSPRCQQLIDMLFFETPVRPYAAVAAELGIAIGSVGFIRGRCLDRLRQELLKAGL